jgi:hypothetical protein
MFSPEVFPIAKGFCSLASLMAPALTAALNCSVSRIRKAYEAKFRRALQQFGARGLDQGVNLLLRKAEEKSDSEGISLPTALARVYTDLAARRAKYLVPRGLDGHPKKAFPEKPPIFLCDAGLGGLARWLRAAGYEARWRADIDDDELLSEARKSSAIMLTTDSILMERRLLRDGLVPALWLPPILSIPEQLALVFREFDLKRGEPRCMSCGGELRRVDKEALRERIPPRTYRWLDEYFVCSRCDRLFWRGTHWERINRELETTVG